jgi:hypothetical protein
VVDRYSKTVYTYATAPLVTSAPLIYIYSV